MTNAPEKPSSALAQDTIHALAAIEAHAAAFPNATYYEITSELEAAQILLSMAAMIKQTAKSIRNPADKNTYREVASRYRAAVNQGKALQTFANMSEADQLELYGLKLVAKRRYKPGEEPAEIVTMKKNDTATIEGVFDGKNGELLEMKVIQDHIVRKKS